MVFGPKRDRSAMVESNEELVPLTAALISEDGDKERDAGKEDGVKGRSSPRSGMWMAREETSDEESREACEPNSAG